MFRIILNYLAKYEPESVRRNIEYIAEYGRYDDLLCLIGTPCEKDALRIIEGQLKKDIASDTGVSHSCKMAPFRQRIKTRKRYARHAVLHVCSE